MAEEQTSTAPHGVAGEIGEPNDESGSVLKLLEFER